MSLSPFHVPRSLVELPLMLIGISSIGSSAMVHLQLSSNSLSTRKRRKLFSFSANGARLSLGRWPAVPPERPLPRRVIGHFHNEELT
jgi:hypothetical protein